MSKKKGASPPPAPPPPKPKPAPAKSPPFLPTLLAVLVCLIAGACIYAAFFSAQSQESPVELHTTQPARTEASQAEPTESRPTEPQPTETQPSETEPEQTHTTEDEGPKFDKDLLILVNAWNPIPEDYEPQLVALESWSLYVAEVAYDDLVEMLADGRAEGLRFQICSAYRSRGEQKSLFDEDVNRYMRQGDSQVVAETKAALYTQRPGHSEHHTGLALDIIANSYQILDAGQASTAENKWLREHCHEYGFILRYPEDKEDETGIAYESWHFRYVGHEAAAWLTEQNMTLEEYWSRYGSY